jgi:replicative DNA helicase
MLKDRKEFNLLAPMISEKLVDPQTHELIKDFKRYFDSYPSHNAIDWPTFIPRFKTWHPSLKEEQFHQYVGVIRNIIPDADEDQRRNIMQDLADHELMTALGNSVLEFETGDLPDAYSMVSAHFDRYRSRLNIRHRGFIDTPIGDLLSQEFDDSGVKWRLDCLNRSMRPLRGGDFGIVAGRPDKGKTSFIASEVTYMAAQLPDERNILWLNNEGPGARIIPRLYQAALDLSMEGLKDAHTQGHLVEQYRSTVGRLDRIRVCDIHGFNVGQVEQLIEENKAGIVVYDMIDNIKGFGGEARTDLALEEMYKWARERAVKFDLIGLATSQISNDGDGLQFPTLGMLKDSKTGKQGACDFQLMIGASNDPLLAGSRFLGLPKNKLRRPDGPADPRAEVIFDGIRSRYRDPPMQVG